MTFRPVRGVRRSCIGAVKAGGKTAPDTLFPPARPSPLATPGRVVGLGERRRTRLRRASSGSRGVGNSKTFGATLWVHQIATDFILGVWTDELDVEHVRRYRVKRRSGER